MLHWFWAQSEIDGGHQRDKLLLHTFMDVKTKITTAKLSYLAAAAAEDHYHKGSERQSLPKTKRQLSSF